MVINDIVIQLPTPRRNHQCHQICNKCSKEQMLHLMSYFEGWLVISSPKIYHGINQMVVRDP